MFEKARQAEVSVPHYYATKFGIETNSVQHATILGLFQYSDAEDSFPVFVCELCDGRCMDVAVDRVKFIEEVPNE